MHKPYRNNTQTIQAQTIPQTIYKPYTIIIHHKPVIQNIIQTHKNHMRQSYTIIHRHPQTIQQPYTHHPHNHTKPYENLYNKPYTSHTQIILNHKRIIQNDTNTK